MRSGLYSNGSILLWEKCKYSKTRKIAGTDTEGTNLKGLSDVAKIYGLRNRVVKGDNNAIRRNLPTPFIAYIKVQKENASFSDHYVVVKHIGKKKIEIWNPDSNVGKQKLTYEEFFKTWTGYAIFLEPDTGFKKSDKKENLLLKFIPVFLPHKKLLAFSFLCSVLLLAFGIITSFYNKYIFDEVVYSKAAFSLHTLSLGVLLVTVIQSVVQFEQKNP